MSKSSKPIEHTAKGTARRRPMLELYKEEISALYSSFADSSQNDIAPPSRWGDSEGLEFVRKLVARAMTTKLKDDEDIFQRGCDRFVLCVPRNFTGELTTSLSLQAMYIRNAIVRALRRTTHMDTQHVPSDFVYSHPTISSLAAAIDPKTLATQRGHVVDDRTEVMTAMVEQYSSQFSRQRTVNPAEDDFLSDDRVVVVTGTTGRLGSHILSQLLADTSVITVYALNRGPLSKILHRQEAAFDRWKLDGSALKNSKLVLLEADLSRPDLGISNDVHAEVCNLLSIIYLTYF